jgi:formylglycine-generating enzyme required for sulfatase activity
MPKIFLCYRRRQSAAHTGRIHDRLLRHFGDSYVFLDIDWIPPGEDFREYITSSVAQCRVLLAVMGPNWVGRTFIWRQIDNPKDFVRLEIETALERKIPVIPILIDGARMPGEEDLPPSLVRLAYCHAVEVDQGPDFGHQVDRLIMGIERFLQPPGPDAPAPVTEPGGPVTADPVGKEEQPRRNARPTDDRIGPKLVLPLEPALQESQPPWQSVQKLQFNPLSAGPSNLTFEPTPDGSIASDKRSPESSPSSPCAQAPAVASEPEGSPAARRRVPWFWLSVATLPVLAVVGFVIQVAIGTDTAKTKGVDPKEARSPKRAPPRGKTDPIRARPSREWTNTIGMKFVRIEPGEFVMGSPRSDFLASAPEKPQHRVQLSKALYLGIHEVTHGQYREVMGTTPSYFKESDDLPVERVSWLDAVKFCNRLSRRDGRTPYYRLVGARVMIAGGNGFRLPSEAEWEYACRAGSSKLYPFGDDAGALGEYAWYGENSTNPVGQKRPNAWGLHDMLGNVWEWCADWYDEKYYTSSPVDDPPGAPRALLRVIRGGGWNSFAGRCRPADRNGDPPEYRSYDLGFRVAAFQE